MAKGLTHARLATRSVTHSWRSGALVSLGIAVATAVVTGSLIIGTSVTTSIRERALARIGRATWAVASSSRFRAGLASDIASASNGSFCAAVLAVRGSVRSDNGEAVAPSVNVIGIDPRFGDLFPRGAVPPLPDGGAAVNTALARDLGIHIGDAVLVTVAGADTAPSDTLFARRQRTQATRSLRLDVTAVLPDRGPGGFSLGAGTGTPRNLLVSRQALAEEIGATGSANLILAASATGRSPQEAIARSATLKDLGLRVRADAAQRRLVVQSSGLVLRDEVVSTIRKTAADVGATATAVSVYLATTIRATGVGRPVRSIAYAVVAGADSALPLPMAAGAPPSGPNEIALNQWAADDLHAHLGGSIDMDSLAPPVGGHYQTRRIHLRLSGIVRMAGAGADRALTPEFQGISNAATIGDWDPSFPIDLHRVTPRDELYWKRFRAAPRAFAAPERLRAMWNPVNGSPTAGWITTVAIPVPPRANVNELERTFGEALRRRLDPQTAGISVHPVRAAALQASRGSTEFGPLFLGMGMFLVAAGAGLASTLMALAVRRRAGEVGILQACGFGRRSVSCLLLAESGTLALLGAAVGAPLGIGYAAGILKLLATRWSGAVAGAPVDLHVAASDVAAGAVVGLVVGMVAVYRSARTLESAPAVLLLHGWQAVANAPDARSRRSPAIAVGLALLSVVLAVLGSVGILPATTAFFMVGAVLLIAGMVALGWVLDGGRRPTAKAPTFRLLALRNAGVNRGHSLLVAGLLASATFVLVTVAANTRDYRRSDVRDKRSGAGGFSLIATASLNAPIEFSTPAGRAALGFDPADEPVLRGIHMVPLLRHAGDDASCLNLAKPLAPGVLGAGPEMIARDGFTVRTSGGAQRNPWLTLQRPPEAGGAVPTFGDSESVEWILKSGLGQVVTTPDAAGRPLRMRLQGLLSAGIFASDLIVSRDSFLQAFPTERSPGCFLIETPPGTEQAVAMALRRNLGELGVQVRDTREILNELIGVQNAYLATFLELGGLGLLMGTIGLAAVILRSAADRQQEFALMLASGFQPRDIARMLVLEHESLLMAGVVGGTACALLATAPHLLSSESSVNWGALGGMLMAVLAVGYVVCHIAGAMASRGRLIEALRSE